MDNELYHYGVLGMKWGVRRYQDANGHLTSEGHRRYGKKIKRKEKLIEQYAKSREAKGYKYLGQAREYRMKKRLYDHYGINSDFEKNHTVELSYKGGYSSIIKGRAEVKSILVKYKDVIAKEKGTSVIFYNKDGTVDHFSSSHQSAVDTLRKIYGNKAVSEFLFGKPKKPKPKKPRNKNDLTTRFERAKKDRPDLTYKHIYDSKEGRAVYNKWLKEWNGDKSFEEDTSLYKQMEDEWLKKHGY